MKTKNPELAKDTVNQTIVFLQSKGYTIIPHGSEGWEHKLAENIYEKQATEDNYFFRIELAPAKWPQLEKYPDVNMNETPYNGLMFSLTCQRWYTSEKVEHISHKEKVSIMKSEKLKESDLFPLWKLTIKDFPLFSNNADLHPGKFLESMENAETFILEMENKMQEYLVKN